MTVYQSEGLILTEKQIKADPIVAIRTENIVKKQGNHTVLDGVSLIFAEGGVHGILGPSGAGKTALLEILSCGDTDFSGTVQIAGKDPRTERSSLKKIIGYVPHDPWFYPDMTAVEILNFFGEARGVPSEKRYRQIKEALVLVNMEDQGNRLTAKMTESELRRLSLAGALLGNPDILLLDDPISSEQDREFWCELIRMLGKLKTVILATSSLTLARELCADTSILSRGAVLVQDTFESLENKLCRSRVLQITTSGDARALTEAMEKLDGVIGCETARNVKTGDLRLQIEYFREKDIRVAVTEQLHSMDAPILSMMSSALSLEEVYHSLTVPTESRSLLSDESKSAKKKKKKEKKERRRKQ